MTRGLQVKNRKRFPIDVLEIEHTSPDAKGESVFALTGEAIVLVHREVGAAMPTHCQAERRNRSTSPRHELASRPLRYRESAKRAQPRCELYWVENLDARIGAVEREPGLQRC